MATPTSRPRRGVSDIRTRTAGASREQSAYRSCFVMGALELEKMRKLKERQIAAQRIAAIDERLRRIDSEMDSLRQALGLSRTRSRDDQSRNDQNMETPVSQSPRNGFRLKY